MTAIHKIASATRVRPDKLRHILRSRRTSAREFLVASLFAGALLFGFGAAGGKIELWNRLHLWYTSDLIGAQDHAVPGGTQREPAASSEEGNAEFRLTHDPFLTFTKRTGTRLHPLIDTVAADFHGDRDIFMGQTTERYWEERDFFGFRNDFNAYFEPGTYTYIVMTGNSEAVGFTHDTTIAQNLQNILNARSGKRYRVLNLAMNSVTTANEINYFVNLGFDLHPAFVISHSFAMDMLYGYQSPPEFRSMGLFYQVAQKFSIERIHAGNYDPKAFELAEQSASETHLLEGCIRNLRRYRALAEASGAKFILGIQKFDASRVRGLPGPVGQFGYDRVARMYARFKEMIAHGQVDVDVIDFNAYSGVELYSATDAIHTTDSSARRIAEIYADHILALERNK